MLQYAATHCKICYLKFSIGNAKGFVIFNMIILTHCNTLSHTAIHSHTLQHTLTHCNTLSHTATHSHTLQHIPTHCNTLHVQHTETHCKLITHVTRSSALTIRRASYFCCHYHHTLQNTATHCNTLQHTAACNTLQHPATHCSTLQLNHTWYSKFSVANTKRLVFFTIVIIRHCNTLQHTATHCNTLQHIATHCNTRYLKFSISDTKSLVFLRDSSCRFYLPVLHTLIQYVAAVRGSELQ